MNNLIKSQMISLVSRTETLPLWSSFLELFEHFPFARASYQLITPCSLFAPVQNLLLTFSHP